MIKLKYLLLLLPLLMLGCKKEELLNPPQPGKTISLTVKGYVMKDTLEFVLKDKVIGTAIDDKFKLSANLFNSNDKVQIRKKSDKKSIGDITITESPFNQVRKIFYDGTTLSNNLELTPVTKPDNMGFRLRFSTTFPDFYGGPVDIEFFVLLVNFETFEFSYTPVKKIKNVTGAFGEFIELEPLEESTDLKSITYVFKVYKAGTNELPYTSTQNLQISDPDNNYSIALPFKKGASELLSISPTLYEGTPPAVGDGYVVDDFSAPFK